MNVSFCITMLSWHDVWSWDPKYHNLIKGKNQSHHVNLFSTKIYLRFSGYGIHIFWNNEKSLWLNIWNVVTLFTGIDTFQKMFLFYLFSMLHFFIKWANCVFLIILRLGLFTYMHILYFSFLLKSRVYLKEKLAPM